MSTPLTPEEIRELRERAALNEEIDPYSDTAVTSSQLLRMIDELEAVRSKVAPRKSGGCSHPHGWCEACKTIHGMIR